MRVTSAIFMLESPRNGVQGTGAAFLRQFLPATDQGESKTFVSLYSGKTSVARIDASTNGKRRAATRHETCFAVSIEIRIDCARNGYLGPDTSN